MAESENTSVRTVLADDHPVVRAGLRSILRQWPRVEVVGEAGDGRELLALVRSSVPDLVVLDIGMPELNGIDATREIRQEHPATRILVCSVHASETTVIDAIEAGANGYILKDAAPEELERAARAVVTGRAYFSPIIASVMVNSLNQRSRRRLRLSPRERQVVQLVSEGVSLEAIGKQLFVSVQTVKTHRANAMRKVEVSTTAGLVRYALQHGLTNP